MALQEGNGVGEVSMGIDGTRSKTGWRDGPDDQPKSTTRGAWSDGLASGTRVGLRNSRTTDELVAGRSPFGRQDEVDAKALALVERPEPVVPPGEPGLHWVGGSGMCRRSRSRSSSFEAGAFVVGDVCGAMDFRRVPHVEVGGADVHVAGDDHGVGEVGGPRAAIASRKTSFSAKASEPTCWPFGT